MRVLSRELDFEILEWRNSMSERRPSAFTNEEPRPDGEPDLRKPYQNCTTEILLNCSLAHTILQRDQTLTRKTCLTNFRLF